MLHITVVIDQPHIYKQILYRLYAVGQIAFALVWLGESDYQRDGAGDWLAVLRKYLIARRARPCLVALSPNPALARHVAV